MNRTKIWQYWETPRGRTKPTYIAMCQEATRRVCHSCDVTLVTPETLADYLPDIPFDLDSIRLVNTTAPAIALKADYIRIALLQKYGGMWLDSDCVPFRDLGEILPSVFARYEFYGMRKTSTNGVLSNGAIGSVAGGKIVTEALRRINARIQEKLSTNEGFMWIEVGAGILGPVADLYPETMLLEPEKNFHPFHFEQSEDLWQPSDRVQLADVIDADTKLMMLYNNRSTHQQQSLSRRQILNGTSLVSQALRRSLGRPAPRPPAVANGLTAADVELVFTTFNRPQSCLDFVRSIRAELGDDLDIHFAVQGESHPFYQQAESDYGCRVSYLPHDHGLAASRNHLLEACAKPILFLCDDDFLFDHRTRLERALEVLSLEPDIGILGGLCENYDYSPRGELKREAVATAFNHLCWEDAFGMHFLPSQYLELPREFLDETYYVQEMHTVNNFALMRRNLFDELDLKWEPACKITGEHERFYHDFHAHNGGRYRVCYTNLLVTQHHRKTDPVLKQYRSRLDGLYQSMRSRGLGQLRFLGKRLEINSQNAGVQRTSDRWWTRP